MRERERVNKQIFIIDSLLIIKKEYFFPLLFYYYLFIAADYKRVKIKIKNF